jgi:hypothetical protein
MWTKFAYRLMPIWTADGLFGILSSLSSGSYTTDRLLVECGAHLQFCRLEFAHSFGPVNPDGTSQLPSGTRRRRRRRRRRPGSRGKRGKRDKQSERERWRRKKTRTQQRQRRKNRRQRRGRWFVRLRERIDVSCQDVFYDCQDFDATGAHAGAGHRGHKEPNQAANRNTSHKEAANHGG